MKVALVFHQVELSIPLGAAYCSAVLKKRGFECQVFEAGSNTDRMSFINKYPVFNGHTRCEVPSPS